MQGLIGREVKPAFEEGATTFETAPLLVPCVVANGQFDVEGAERKYLQVSVNGGQALRVVFRTRGVGAKSVNIGLHGPDGGQLSGWTVYGESNVTKPLEYKAY